MKTLHEADLFTVVNNYSQAEEQRWKHQFGDADFSLATVAVSAAVEADLRSSVAPAVEAWDRRLLARDAVYQAQLLREVQQQ